MSKLSHREKVEIIQLYSTGKFTMRFLAKFYEISAGRVSQLVNNNFNEHIILIGEKDGEE